MVSHRINIESLGFQTKENQRASPFLEIPTPLLSKFPNSPYSLKIRAAIFKISCWVMMPQQDAVFWGNGKTAVFSFHQFLTSKEITTLKESSGYVRSWGNDGNGLDSRILFKLISCR